MIFYLILTNLFLENILVKVEIEFIFVILSVGQIFLPRNTYQHTLVYEWCCFPCLFLPFMRYESYLCTSNTSSLCFSMKYIEISSDILKCNFTAVSCSCVALNLRRKNICFSGEQLSSMIFINDFTFNVVIIMT